MKAGSHVIKSTSSGENNAPDEVNKPLHIVEEDDIEESPYIQEGITKWKKIQSARSSGGGIIDCMSFFFSLEWIEVFWRQSMLCVFVEGMLSYQY